MGFAGSSPEGSGEEIEWGLKFSIEQRTDNVIFVEVPRYSDERSRRVGS